MCCWYNVSYAHCFNSMIKKVKIVRCILEWCKVACINPFIFSHEQLQTINQHSNINTTLDLCKIVYSYYQVKAVDNTSDIYNTLETIANDTLTFWVSFMLPSISYVHLSLGHMYHVCYSHKSAVAMCMNILTDLLNLFLHEENCTLQRQLHWCRPWRI